MLIIDRSTFEDWTRIVKQDAIDYLNDIFSYNVDIIAFENMYSVCIYKNIL